MKEETVSVKHEWFICSRRDVKGQRERRPNPGTLVKIGCMTVNLHGTQWWPDFVTFRVHGGGTEDTTTSLEPSVHKVRRVDVLRPPDTLVATGNTHELFRSNTMWGL